MADKTKLLKEIESAVDLYCGEEFDFAFDPTNPIVRLHEPTFGAREINAAIKQMLSTNVTMGTKVIEFEDSFCEKFGFGNGVMNNSGSSANLLAVAAVANPQTKGCLKRGDEVLVPALSWSTTVWPLIQHGLVPVFVDCCPRTLNIDVQAMSEAITSKTKAIMLVHVYGNPCDMNAICKLAADNGLWLIEDSCESMGASYNGQQVGSFGDLGTFSFYFSHHITTFEGGITVTKDFGLSETLRILRAHGWSREARKFKELAAKHSNIDPRFIFVNQGYNLRPTEIQAVVGMEQLKIFDDICSKRRENVAFLRNELQPFSKYFDFQEEQENALGSWFGFAIRLTEAAKFTNRELGDYLRIRNIENRPIIAGDMSRHPAFNMYEHRSHGSLDNAKNVMDRGIAVGCHQALNQEALTYVAESISQFLSEKG